MSKFAVEHSFAGTASYTYSTSSVYLGPLMWKNSGATDGEKWVGPYPIKVGRPMEQVAVIPAQFPHVINYSSSFHYVFFSDGAAAAATRRISMWKYDKNAQTLSFNGYVTITPPTTTNHTIRGFRMLYYSASNGSVMVTGSAVTGALTSFSEYGFATGSRIAFGTAVPQSASTWYQITQVSGNNSNLTLGSSVTASFTGTYVIEELQALLLTTNATLATGGLYISKGLNPDIFIPGGTTIPAATTVNNIRACYWLHDIAANTMGTGSGIAVAPMNNYGTHSVYILDGSATVLNVYKFNVKKSLTGSILAGKSTAAFQYKTATQSVVGNVGQQNNSRYAVLSHGPGSGSPGVYFATTTRVYRMDEAGITSGAVNCLSDVMTENPPGGILTFGAGSVMNAVEYLNSIDRLMIQTTNATSLRSYITQYITDGGQFDHIIGYDVKQMDNSTSSVDVTPLPLNNLISQLSMWGEEGILYISRVTAVSNTNQIYTLPLGADWQYASNTGNRIITPVINTPGASKYYSVYVDDVGYLGSVNLGTVCEPWRMYARTSNFSDATTGWALVSRSDDLVSYGGSEQIQFMFEFRIIGQTCIPNRLYSIAVLYEGSDTDSHYTPSTAESDVSNRIFAWRQATSWGSNIPAMRIRIYNVSNEAIELDDDTATPTLGTWEYSTNGIAWNAWDNTQDVIGYYIRYTATSLPDGITVRALLTQV